MTVRLPPAATHRHARHCQYEFKTGTGSTVFDTSGVGALNLTCRAMRPSWAAGAKIKAGGKAQVRPRPARNCPMDQGHGE
jgi:hypothetical protein